MKIYAKTKYTLKINSTELTIIATELCLAVISTAQVMHKESLNTWQERENDALSLIYQIYSALNRLKHYDSMYVRVKKIFEEHNKQIKE